MPYVGFPLPDALERAYWQTPFGLAEHTVVAPDGSLKRDSASRPVTLEQLFTFPEQPIAPSGLVSLTVIRFAISFKSDKRRESRALVLAEFKLARIKDASIPIIATTTKSSIRVKPSLFLKFIFIIILKPIK